MHPAPFGGAFTLMLRLPEAIAGGARPDILNLWKKLGVDFKQKVKPALDPGHR